MGFWVMISLLFLGLLLFSIGNKKAKRFSVFFKLSGSICLLVAIWLGFPK
ncbi:DUF3953 domain-containing protein [Vagococcus hydrophili]|uniref:DUF3953 domain-containing protein n=1 Tax=Vagococcus hydrophili TaxID=2714947 RepID=A0A6G8AUG4_9ENTE|nr:DUF3953 domain-containing protein [Vagococcus hydrophili]QIL48609.1 DUF3953 domain-containing protein [Vagococcus hydrophili]